MHIAPDGDSTPEKQTATQQLVAWRNGQWLDEMRVGIGLRDIGFVSGAVIVDRLRTVHGQPLDVDEHVARFRKSCDSVAIRLPADLDFGELLQDCAARNAAHFEGRDFSLVVLATPGTIGNQEAIGSQEPTLIVHSTPIDWSRLHAWYTRGQTLVVGDTQNVPHTCWSPQIKTRARLQYYLADQMASTQGPYAGGLLLDRDGCLTETSTANVLLVEQDRIVSPPERSILRGISLHRTTRLLAEAGNEVVYEPIHLDRVRDATGLLLVGTTGCVWAARRVFSVQRQSEFAHDFPSPLDLPILQRLQRLWQTELGLDFVAQAAEYGSSDVA